MNKGGRISVAVGLAAAAGAVGQTLQAPKRQAACSWRPWQKGTNSRVASRPVRPAPQSRAEDFEASFVPGANNDTLPGRTEGATVPN